MELKGKKSIVIFFVWLTVICFPTELLEGFFFKACEFLRENLGTYWAKHSSKEKCSALCFLRRNCKTSTSCFLLC